MTGERDDEPTAGALIADPRLDPELAARLQRWFGDDAREPAGDGSPSDDSPVDRDRHIAELLDQADPELLARIIDHDYTITRDHRAMAARVGRGLTGFVPTVTLGLRVPEVYTARAPYDIEDALREDNVPQALLRDLHRPVWDFDPGERDEVPLASGIGAPHRDACDAAHAALTRVRQLVRSEPAMRSAARAIGDMRSLLAETWPLGRDSDDGGPATR